MQKYSAALRGFQASVAARQVEGEPLGLQEPYYEFLTRLRSLREQDEVSEEDFDGYSTCARLVLCEFDSSDNPRELFGAEKDASPSATVVPTPAPAVPSVSMLLSANVPHASPSPSMLAVLPLAGLFGPASSQSSRAASHLSVCVQPRIVLPHSDDTAAGEKHSRESSPPGSFKVCRSCFCWSSVNLSVVFTLPYGQGELLCQPRAVVQSMPALEQVRAAKELAVRQYAIELGKVYADSSQVLSHGRSASKQKGRARPE